MDELLAAARLAVTFFNDNPSGPAMVPATALNVAIDKAERMAVDLVSNIGDFLTAIQRLHKPVPGESTEDRDCYCSCCMSRDGGSARWPCGTIRAARRFLGLPK